MLGGMWPHGLFGVNIASGMMGESGHLSYSELIILLLLCWGECGHMGYLELILLLV